MPRHTPLQPIAGHGSGKHYPSAFYTVALQWADDKEIPSLMAEMERCSSAKIVPPDINRSGTEFFTDYATDEIFWSLTRIKQVGVKTVEYIVTERDRGRGIYRYRELHPPHIPLQTQEIQLLGRPRQRGRGRESPRERPACQAHDPCRMLRPYRKKVWGGYRTLRAARTRSTGTGILPFWKKTSRRTCAGGISSGRSSRLPCRA